MSDESVPKPFIKFVSLDGMSERIDIPRCAMCRSSEVQVFEDQEFVTAKGNNSDIVEFYDETFCLDCEHLETIQRGTRRVYHDSAYKEPNGRPTSPSRHGT